MNYFVNVPSSFPIRVKSNAPEIKVPLYDRVIAKVTRSPLFETLLRRSGLDAQIQKVDSGEIFTAKLSGARALQLFYIDALTNHGQFFFSLLSQSPQIIEDLLTPLRRDEQILILQQFGQPVPVLTAFTAKNCGALLAHLNDRCLIEPVLDKLLSHSDLETKAATLCGLFNGDKLDFSLLLGLNQTMSPHPEANSDSDKCCLVSAALRLAQKCHNTELACYLHIFTALIFHALPRYKNYWSECTGLPADACPVHTDAPGLHASLAKLTLRNVLALSEATDSEKLLDLATRLGWRRIQSRSIATLQNPDPAAGDFIYRTFEALLPHRIASY